MQVLSRDTLDLKVGCDQQKDDARYSQRVDQRRQEVVLLVRHQVLSEQASDTLLLPKEESVDADHFEQSLKVACKQGQACHHAHKYDEENHQDEAQFLRD